jgi:stage IV sporulation protein FA
MDNEIDKVRQEIKNKKNKKVIVRKYPKYLSKILIVIIITLITLILLKTNTKFKTLFYKNVYETNFSFASLNKWYKDKFGSPIPFSDVIKNSTSSVFNEKLEYKEKSKYLDGVKLEVSKNYLVPALESGMVVFIGDKDKYGSTVIIQQIDGIDVWYSNINASSIKLYDYIEKGSLIGEVKDNYLYLVYKKDGKVLNYEDYL